VRDFGYANANANGPKADRTENRTKGRSYSAILVYRWELSPRFIFPSSFTDECSERIESQRKMHTDDAPKSIPPGPRKSMGRGTHSCYECRRRKVRCIFAKDSTICEGCAARGKRCAEQRREPLHSAALDTKESLRERVARLEAIIQASSSDGGSAVVDQTSSRSELDPRDTQPDIIRKESSPSSVISNPTPASISSPNAPLSIDKDSTQNIDPIVTLFDNAVVSLIVYLSLWQLRPHIVETT
jgi:hypothetical protein